MLSEYEAARLQRDMRAELDGTAGAMMKSAVGLLVVVLLALIGSSLDLDLNREPPAGQAAAQTGTVQRL